MKLIKLTDDHYVVVDDSEIKEGDWYIDDTLQILQALPPRKDWINSGKNGHIICKKITHSTQPLGIIHGENGKETIAYGSIGYISISEVKELIGDADVEKKAREEVERYMISTSSIDLKAKIQRFQGYMKGYNQALEDNKEKKYTEADVIYIIDNISRNWFKCYSEKDKKEHILNITKELQKTEWEVEWEICETYKLDECNSRFACCGKPKKLKLI